MNKPLVLHSRKSKDVTEYRPKVIRFIKLATRNLGPIALAVAASSAAHAQGTIDFSGATTFMTTIKNFALLAGSLICLVCLVFAVFKFMARDVTEGFVALFGVLIGAACIGWGAGWIGSATGQAVQ